MKLYNKNGLINNIQGLQNIEDLDFSNTVLMEVLSLDNIQELENYKNDFIYLSHKLKINNEVYYFMDYEGYIFYYGNVRGYIINIMIEYIFGISYFLGHTQNRSFYYNNEKFDGIITDYNGTVLYIELELFAKYQFNLI